MPHTEAKLDCEALCAVLLPQLRAAGFGAETLQLLAGNLPLLRSTLARASAVKLVRPELRACSDPRFPHAAAFSCGLEPLGLEPQEWIDFIAERSRLAGTRSCELLSGTDFGREKVFVKCPAQAPQTLLLVETSNGTRAESDLLKTADTLLPSSPAKTTARLIFEVLRHLWNSMSDINAAYVVVADPRRESGAPMPIVFNPPKGPLRLGFVNQVPKNDGYNGYLAYSV